MKLLKKCLYSGVFFLLLLLPMHCLAYSMEVAVPLETLKTLHNNNKEILKEQRKSAEQLKTLDNLTKKQATTIKKQAELLTIAGTQLKELERRQNETTRSFANLLKEQKKETNRAERQRNILAILLGVFIYKSI